MRSHDRWDARRISSPVQIEDLIEILRSEPDAMIERVADEEVEVSLLGAYAPEPMRIELFPSVARLASRAAWSRCRG